jgi:hypothetical protein
MKNVCIAREPEQFGPRLYASPAALKQTFLDERSTVATGHQATQSRQTAFLIVQNHLEVDALITLKMCR